MDNFKSFLKKYKGEIIVGVIVFVALLFRGAFKKK
jgi:hypothetical protein